MYAILHFKNHCAKRNSHRYFHLTVSKQSETILSGQFYMLKSWDDSLPLMRPLSVFYVENDRLHFLYKKIGKGTELLSLLLKGDNIELLGPLGNGFPVKEVSGKIALIGGGIGIFPLLETAKENKNNMVISLILGMQNF
ncbi:MAG: hypothetical protein FWH59_04310 [Lentimicrobiaceae bacterium]|nr:hypothetical protein [Lentimicrobiaceae bacterium]